MTAQCAKTPILTVYLEAKHNTDGTRPELRRDRRSIEACAEFQTVRVVCASRDNNVPEKSSETQQSL